MKNKSILFSTALFLFSSPLLADSNYPSKPVKIVVPYTAGGGTDQYIRLLSPYLSEALGNSIVIENKPGAATTLGARQVATSKADGYTLLMSTGGTFSLTPYTMNPNPYSPAKDFDYIGVIGETAMVLSSGPSGPDNFKDLVKLSKEQPGRYNYSTSGAGNVSHLGMELLQNALNFKMNMIPFKGVEGSVAVGAGHVEVGVDGESAAAPLMQAGKIKPILVLQQKRSPTLPDTPSLADFGIKDETITGISLIIAAPSGTPQAVKQKLYSAFEKALTNEEVLKKLPLIRTKAVLVNGEETKRVVEMQRKAYKEIFIKNKFDYYN